MTPVNYLQMNDLYARYKDQGFTVLAFPCNQFGGQEPGTNADIKDTVRQGHKSEFPLFAKIKVNGNEAHPLWKFLKEKQSGTLVSAIKWNFSKFLCDRNGMPVKRYSPTTKPKELEKDIQELLAQKAPQAAPQAP